MVATKVEGFKCDTCLKLCSTKEQAENCEKSHATNMVWQANFNEPKFWPSSITIKAINKDGHEVTAEYERF